MADAAPAKRSTAPKKGKGDRSFRRLDAQDAPTAPLPVAWAFGLGLGLVGGLAALVWDVFVLEQAGLPVWPTLDAPALAPWVVGYAALGAAVGLAAGATGLFGARWAAAAAITAVGWTLGGGGAEVAAAAGLPAAVGLLGPALLAWIAGQLLARLPLPPAVPAAVAASLFATTLVAFPVIEHLTASGTTAGAALLVLAALALSLPFAGVCAVTARDGRPPLVSLLVLLSLGAGAAVASRPPGPPAPPSEGDGPLIVVLALDGVRAGDLASLPSLGRLKATRFEQARSTSNWAVPSLGSVLTGRWPYGHQAGLNGGAGPTGAGLDPRVPAIAEVLGRRGLATLAVTSDPDLRRYGLDRGFQSFEDRPAATPAAAGGLRRAGMLPAAFAQAASAAWVTDRAVAAVGRTGGTFLLVHHTALRDGRGDVAAFDGELGRLLAALPDRAWLFVLGTHGRPTTDRRASVEDAASDGMFDERVHVPLLVAGPQVPVRRVDRVVSVVDVAATLRELLREKGLGPAVEVDPGDGAPLTEIFGSPGPVDRTVFAQSSGRGPERQLAVSWPWALVTTPGGAALYDLARDPLEQEPLRIDPSLDPVERRLAAAIPTPGSPLVHGETPGAALQLGALVERIRGGGR